jgi:hypothetical protein
MKKQMQNLFVALALLSALNLQPSTAFAQSMVFTFQGRVLDSDSNFAGIRIFKSPKGCEAHFGGNERFVISHV